MRRELFYSPRLLCERLAVESVNRRRKARLRNTVAAKLHLHDISSLELLELMAQADIGVIYDIGAHVGTWSLLAKAVFPRAEIHAFEPLEQHRSAFLDHFAEIDDVTLHSVALGAASMPAAVFHITDSVSSSSFLPLADASRFFGLSEVGQAAIPLHRLDDFRAERQLKPPDLIKLDVQGYELEALKGAEQCTAAAKAVLMEVSFVKLYRDQPLFDEIVGHMADHGFRIYGFSSTTPLGQPLVQTDVLFLNAQKA